MAWFADWPRGTVSLIFTGAVSAGARDAQYAVSQNGEPVAVADMHQPASNQIVLHCDGLTGGSGLAVHFNLDDTLGRAVKGAAVTTVH